MLLIAPAVAEATHGHCFACCWLCLARHQPHQQQTAECSRCRTWICNGACRSHVSCSCLHTTSSRPSANLLRALLNYILSLFFAACTHQASRRPSPRGTSAAGTLQATWRPAWQRCPQTLPQGSQRCPVTHCLCGCRSTLPRRQWQRCCWRLWPRSAAAAAPQMCRCAARHSC